MEAERKPEDQDRHATAMADEPHAASDTTTHEKPLDSAASSPRFSDTPSAGSHGPEAARKGSNEWSSPRSVGRRGTPPPMPRRASRGIDPDIAITEVELPPWPRTPAQVLASRAAAAKASAASVSAPFMEETAMLFASTGGETLEEKRAVSGPERGGEVDVADGGGGSKDERIEYDVPIPVDPEDDPLRRRSVHLSAMESDQYFGSDEEDGESFRRDDRIDTSTVDEESMYNDEDDEEEEDYAVESPGTSDEYVNIHDEEKDEGEDEDQQQQLYHGGDDSLTPDSTPPPSPPRLMRRDHHQRPRPLQPKPMVTEWVKYVAESGHDYYFNLRTNASQWTRPMELLSPRHAGMVEEEGDDDGPEENQSADSGGALLPRMAQMLPQLHMHLPVSQPQPQPPLDHTTTHTATPLENLFAAAARSDETAQLQAILQFDVDVNAVNASQLTSLHVAVQHGNARGAAMLLDYGALVDGPLDETSGGGLFASARLTETPLVMACRTNHASLVRLLVRYGASIYTLDNDGNSVLHIAIRCWSEEVLSCLLEMDSVAAILNQRNTEDETPLHLAARHGNAMAVKALLASYASRDVEDAQGRTPLIVSIMENRIDCAELLQGAEHNHDAYGDGAVVPDSNAGPVVYDASPKEDGTKKEERNDVDGLRLYLSQLVQHTTTDGVLLSTIYQYMDAVQREIAVFTSQNAESRQREETLLSQIDELTTRDSTITNELAKEREKCNVLREQLEAKHIELNSQQAAYESLASRSTMLESIARSSQDKLRRERAEFARQEEYWNQTIDNSLRENAALLEAVHSLQQGWQPPSALGDAGTTTTSHEGHEEYEDSYDTVPQQISYDEYAAPASYDEYAAPASYDPYEAYYAKGEAYGEAYDTSQHGLRDARQSSTTQNLIEPQAAASALSTKSEKDRPISPERVDAVWNRFFENMSRTGEGRDAQVYPSAQNPTAAPVSMLPPASALFDAVRKNKNDRLHDLLLSGLSPNTRDLGEKGTPLHLASELGDLDPVMLLCEFGADVEVRDESGNTPLLVACSQGHYDCTKFLLQSAANHAAVNDARDTALHLAAWDGSFECVEILLEYGVDVLARNSLGLTALSNLKTRSSLRHRFHDLAIDHQMAKTLALLNEAEQFEKDEHDGQTHPTAEPTTSHNAVKATIDPKPQASTTSWGQWILGSVFGSYKAAAVPETALPVSDDEEKEEDDDDNKDDFEEAESSPSRFQRAASLRDYEDLRPPPEIEAELRRTPLSPASSTPLPPPPPEVLDALEKRKLGGYGGYGGYAGGSSSLLSPTHSVTRFASPASMPGTKKLVANPPTTNVRSRYVDTFNGP